MFRSVLSTLHILSHLIFTEEGGGGGGGEIVLDIKESLLFKVLFSTVTVIHDSTIIGRKF